MKQNSIVCVAHWKLTEEMTSHNGYNDNCQQILWLLVSRLCLRDILGVILKQLNHLHVKLAFQESQKRVRVCLYVCTSADRNGWAWLLAYFLRIVSNRIRWITFIDRVERRKSRQSDNGQNEQKTEIRRPLLICEEWNDKNGTSCANDFSHMEMRG